MMENLPFISIIIPVYNASCLLEKCLKSLKNQEYPKEKLEILVIDDNSTDDSVDISKRYGARVFKNGQHNIERGKSIGLEHARYDFVLLLDADNIMVFKDTIRSLVEPLLKYNVVGSYPVYFDYNGYMSMADRYCALFGINDPMSFYTGRRDRLMLTEKKWTLGGNIKEDNDRYCIVDFGGQGDVPTLGSIGFLARKAVLMQTPWKPYFYHIDSCYDLIQQGCSKFAMVKISIRHFHSSSTKELLGKLKRNIDLFFKLRKHRRYEWALEDSRRFLKAVMLMVTVVQPTFDALKGYGKIRDRAWLIHPFISFSTIVIYTYVVIYFKIASLIRKITSLIGGN